MNDPKDPISDVPRESTSDSLADVLPSPINDDRLPYVANLGLGALTLTIASAGAIVLIAGAMTPTMGATRSTKLEWERRKLLMEQAEHELALVPSEEACDAEPNVGNKD